MGTSGALQVWAGRLCLAAMAVLVWAGLYYENIRFLPSAAGFAILAAVSYTRQGPV